MEELSVVDALDELVWVLDVALELVPLEVWVTEELELSVPVVEALSVPEPDSDWELEAPIADVSWPPSPTAVRPPPASAESAARRAQRRAMLIGGLPCSSSYRPLSARSACFLTLSVATRLAVLGT